MTIERLNWDSEFFGLEVGKLKINSLKIDDKVDFIDFDLVYVFSDSKIDLSVASLLKLKLVDIKITYQLCDFGNYIDNSEIVSYKSGLCDPVVIQLGVESSIYSRFKLDKNFNEEIYEKLYTVWMERSIKREISDEVYVYNSNEGCPIAVITLEKQGSVTYIGILAVNTDYRGKNIGKKLVTAAKYFCKIHDSSVLQVVTQKDNVNACKFYERCGFSIKKIEYVYHYWK